ncbi:MAG: PP2C family protein-serine/threonine phosphatase [Myxococcota bacterium]
MTTNETQTNDVAMNTVRLVLQRLLGGEIDAGEAEFAIGALLPAADAIDDVADTVAGLIAGIEEFKGVMGKNPDDTESLMLAARRRFAIQVSATMLDESLPVDTQATSFQRLRDELVHLADRVADLVESTIADAQLRQELEIAGTVQKMLVPAKAVELPGLSASAWFRPADQCSGDWWSLAKLGQTDAILMVADVTGHGAPAAIIAGTAKGALDMARVGMRDALKPFMALNMMNFILTESMQGEYFMSGIMARFEAKNGTLRIANAGHRAPWIFRESGTQVVVGDRSPPLGTSRSSKYTETVVDFAKGDMFVAFTDGLPEAEDANGHQFGERALREVCEKAYPGGPQAVCDAVREAALAHTGDLNRLGDDVTVVAVLAV